MTSIISSEPNFGDDCSGDRDTRKQVTGDATSSISEVEEPNFDEFHGPTKSWKI
jgi:hypothetical protein